MRQGWVMSVHNPGKALGFIPGEVGECPGQIILEVSQGRTGQGAQRAGSKW
jgi:hypothetical protein